jgi:hypothetical protein
VTVTDSTLALFHNGLFWEGLAAMCREQLDKSEKNLKTHPATDVQRIAELQREVKLWEKELPDLKNKVDDYAAKFAATPK